MATIPEALTIALQHHQGGRLQAAEQIYRQILSADPNEATAIHLLGMVAREAGKTETAIEYMRRSIELKPGVAGFHHNLAKAHYALGRFADAVACYRNGLDLEPEDSEGHNNLGVALKQQGRLDEAVACFRHALELNPGMAEAHCNLASVFADQGEISAAVVSCRRALELEPGSPDAHNNLGSSYMKCGLLEESAVCFRRALALKQDYPDAHRNLGLSLLKLGRYQEGWMEYEYRLQCSPAPRTFTEPRWNGQQIEGRTILIHHEQGLGDTLHFARYVALVRRRSGAGRVLFEAQPALARLLRSSGGWDATLLPGLDSGTGPRPAFDFQVPLTSLPLVLGLSEPLRVSGAYVHTDQELRRAWRERIGASAARRVGLVWAGNPSHRMDRIRSMPPEELLPLLRLPGLQLYSSQLGRDRPLPQPLKAAGLIDFTMHIGDFADTAAFISELDLIISVDTAVAHLAGAMALPVWTLLPFQAEWRWGVAGEKTPWYPTMQLFRQHAPGEWEPVIQRVAAELGGAMSS